MFALKKCWFPGEISQAKLSRAKKKVPNQNFHVCNQSLHFEQACGVGVVKLNVTIEKKHKPNVPYK